MLVESARFIREMKDGHPPRWLTLLGTSGAGKTHLAKRIQQWYSTQPSCVVEVKGDEFVYPNEFCRWGDLSYELQNNRGKQWLETLANATLVIIDDIGAAGVDKTGYATGALANLLMQRMNKWTVITANMPLADISDKIDTRVASRMLREGNVAVDVELEDWALVGKKLDNK